MINQYNELVQKIVHNFIKRLYLEDNILEEFYEWCYDLWQYAWVLWTPIEIWDRYLRLDDILICEANWFTANSLIDYYDKDLEASYQNKTLWINYYNYTLKNLDKVAYEKRQANELKESEERVKEAEKEFLSILTSN
jgi:hypothetical protein